MISDYDTLDMCLRVIKNGRCRSQSRLRVIGTANNFCFSLSDMSSIKLTDEMEIIIIGIEVLTLHNWCSHQIMFNKLLRNHLLL